MEKELYIQSLIDKFWAGKASRADRIVLIDYLKDGDNELKSSLEQSFAQQSDPRLLNFVDEALEEALRHKIFEKAGIPQQQEKKLKYWPRLRIATAAAAILVMGTMLWVHNKKGADSQVSQRREWQMAKTTLFQNNGQAKKYITLPDSSTVALYPKSTVSYISSYGHIKRELRLEGTAEFSVVPDKHRPFTVFANGYATTALGTKFIISTRQRDRTTVKLLSGKVVVHATETSRFPMENTYLKPGDELNVNSSDGKFSVVNRSEIRTLPRPASGNRQQEVIEEGSAIGLSFEQTPLSQVFARISKSAGKPISTEGVSLRGLSFSGDFLPTDSIQTMLSIICEVNNLNFRHEQDRVVITKK